MSIFNVDFKILSQQITPPLERQPVQTAWLNSLMTPLQYDNDLFNQYITGSTYPLFNLGVGANALQEILSTAGTGQTISVYFNQGGIVKAGGNVVTATGVDASNSSTLALAYANLLTSQTVLTAASISQFIVMVTPPNVDPSIPNSLEALFVISPGSISFVANPVSFSGASSHTYSTGERVIWTDRGVYENLSGSTGPIPTDTNYWIQVNQNYIGALERQKYNAIHLNFEYAMNRWFQLSGFCPTVLYSAITESLFNSTAQTIYINTNDTTPPIFLMGNTGQYSGLMFNNSRFSTTFMYGNNPTGFTGNEFTIEVPSYLGLATSDITSFADTLNIAGMQYNVNFY